MPMLSASLPLRPKPDHYSLLHKGERGWLPNGGAPALPFQDTPCCELMTMADKTFHLRANEVRAESRALMQKLRAERLATTRHRTKADLTASTVVVAAVAAPMPPKAMTIIPSRKIQAAKEQPSELTAVDTASDQSAQTVDEVVVIAVKKPKRTSRKPITRSVAALIAEAEPVVSQDDAISVVTVETPLAAQECPLEPLSVAAQPPKRRTKKTPKAVAVAAEPAEPAKPAAEAMPEPPASSKPKAARKAARSVKQIIGDGLGSVAELQQAVAEAVAAAPVPATTAVRLKSPRARESIASVPTLGPGMVWRLNQLGIRTLGDLAEMDVEDLRAKLGPVAKLVRVETWIDYAKAA
jgi:hypothetical protein